MIKPRMVRSGESDHKLARLLHEGMKRDATIFQDLGGEDAGLVPQRLGAGSKFFRVEGLGHGFEAVCVCVCV